MSRATPTPLRFPSRRLSAAAVCLAACLVPVPPATSAAVYRCSGGDGPVRFSQFPCGDGTAVVVEPLHTVRIPPLSEAELSLLQNLERQREAGEAARAEAHQRAALRSQARREDRRERCEAARTARASLARERRKGYSLSEARALDRRDADLEAEERRNC